jgi:hypothetical protein
MRMGNRIYLSRVLRKVHVWLALMPFAGMGQWHVVPNASVQFSGAYGPTYSMLMAEPEVGFRAQCTYASASTGTSYSVRLSVDEWSTQEEVFGGGLLGPGCCCVFDLSPLGGNTLFYQVTDNWGHLLRSASYMGGQWIQHSYTLGGGGPYPFRYHPVNDTACYVAATLYPTSGLVFMTARSGQAPLFHDTLNYGWNQTRAMAFHDHQRGALISYRNGGPCETWLTDSATAQWTRVRVDSAIMLNAAKWFNDSTLWLVGEQGTVLRTSDRGQSWDTLSGVGNADYWTVDGYTADSVWIAGEDGEVRVTGDGGATWALLPIQDSTIVLLQAMDGVVYAHCQQSRLYRFGDVPTIEVPIGTWWTPASEGGTLCLVAGEQLRSLQLFDRTGREVQYGLNGNAVDLQGLSAGIYIVQLSTDQREDAAKVFWPGP